MSPHLNILCAISIKQHTTLKITIDLSDDFHYFLSVSSEMNTKKQNNDVVGDDFGVVVEGMVGFQPKKKGTYTVEVTQEGKTIPGSPFRIEVGDGQLCQASKVHITGAIKDATANKWNDVNLKLNDAGTLDHTL